MKTATLHHLIVSRQRRHEETDQEGWMVSYADLITLLFIFFSLLLSISVVSRSKFEMVTKDFNAASTANLVDLQKQLDAEIRNLKLEAQVSTRVGEEGLEIRFSEGVLFETAAATLNPSGSDVLGKFGKILAGLGKGYHVAIEGHTDSRPIRTAAFPSNWELSSTRAVNVLHFLTSVGIPERWLVVRAFADTRPVPAPTGLDSYAQNRRVTLLVF